MEKEALHPFSSFRQTASEESPLSAPLKWESILIQGRELNTAKMLSYVKTENTEKAGFFIETEKTRMLSVFRFLRDRNIIWSGEFFQYFLSRTQKSVLSDLESLRELRIQDSESIWRLVRKLFWIELEKGRKKNVIKDLLTGMRNIMDSCEKAHLDPGSSLDRMESILQDYAEDRIGNKKVLSEFEAELRRRMSEALKLFFSDLSTPFSTGEEIKIDRFLEKHPELHPYLMNLTGIYYRIRNAYPESVRHLEKTLYEMVLNPSIDGNTEAFHRWLYQESPWNREIYRNLTVKSGYNPALWDKGISRSFFLKPEIGDRALKLSEKIRKLKTGRKQNPKTVREILSLREELLRITQENEKIRIEFSFDFLKGSYCGVPLHDCFTPGKEYEMIPVFHALESNALFMRVYNEASGQMMTGIVYVLTPEGLVDLGFATGSSLVVEPLKQPVFEVLSELVNENWIPAVFMNSDKTAYVASAGYHFGSQTRKLKAKYGEFFKQEPWDVEREKDPLGGPRHYANGSNVNCRDADGKMRQYGRFKTGFRLGKESGILNKSTDRYHSLEHIMKDGVGDTEGKRESDNLFEQIRLRLSRKEEDLRRTSPDEARIFRDQMYSHLKGFQCFMEQNCLAVEDLPDKMEDLKKQLAPAFWILLSQVLQGKDSDRLESFMNPEASFLHHAERPSLSFPAEKAA